jgi:hypothetical protein
MGAWRFQGFTLSRAVWASQKLPSRRPERRVRRPSSGRSVGRTALRDNPVYRVEPGQRRPFLCPEADLRRTDRELVDLGGFRMPASRDPSARAEGGPPKASQEGTCGGGGQAVCRLLGFYGAAASVGGCAGRRSRRQLDKRRWEFVAATAVEMDQADTDREARTLCPQHPAGQGTPSPRRILAPAGYLGLQCKSGA